MNAGFQDDFGDIALFQHPEARLRWIGHELANVAARKCSAAAGFVPVWADIEDGDQCVLMVRQARAD